MNNISSSTPEYIVLILSKIIKVLIEPAQYVPLINETTVTNPMNLNDKPFQHEIADKVLECLIERRNTITLSVLLKFHDVYLKYIKICKMQSACLRRNELNISFHGYKTIAERYV